MKVILLSLAIFFIASCGNKESENTSLTDNSRDAISDTTVKPFNLGPSFAKDSRLDQPVNREIAQRCIDAMEALFQGNDMTAMKASYTEEVNFSSSNLQRWLHDFNVLGRSTDIKIRLGIYTEEAIREWARDPRLLGRVTIFIWPYNGAETLTEPFNLGSLHP